MSRNPDFPPIKATATSHSAADLQTTNPNSDNTASDMCRRCPARQPGGLHIGVIYGNTYGLSGREENPIYMGNVKCTSIRGSHEIKSGRGEVTVERPHDSGYQRDDQFDRVTAHATPCGIKPFDLTRGYSRPPTGQFGGNGKR